MNILVVEDERRIATFLTKGLTAHGQSVKLAATGSDALHAARAGGLDVVLLDLGLPDMDGLDVLALLRSEGWDTPVVVLTARAAAEDRRRADALRVASYLVKPCSVGDLLAAMSGVVGAAGPGRADPARPQDRSSASR